jgi:hypothetical protein
VRNINFLKILLDAGYHVTFIPTAFGREHHYTTQLRHMGVQVFPSMGPEWWQLSRDGKCIYHVIMVARVEIFELVKPTLDQHCKGVPIVFDTVYLHFLQQARDAMTAQAAAKNKVGQPTPLALPCCGDQHGPLR